MSERLAFLKQDQISKLRAQDGAAAYLSGGFRRYHILSAEAATIEDNRMIHRFDDELRWELFGGYDTVDAAEAVAREWAAKTLRESDIGLGECYTLVWDSKDGKTIFDSRRV